MLVDVIRKYPGKLQKLYCLLVFLEIGVKTSILAPSWLLASRLAAD